VNDTINRKIEALENARRMLEFVSTPVWAQTAEQTDAQHVEDYADTLKRTRETFPEMPELTAMNCILREDTQLVLAYVGNSPTSVDRASAMVGFLASMPQVIDQFLEGIADEIWLRRRCDELLEHNNEQLFENRAQRRTIVSLKAREAWLLEKLSEVLLTTPEALNNDMPEVVEA
jgi:hypothetical protein